MAITVMSLLLSRGLRVKIMARKSNPIDSGCNAPFQASVDVVAVPRQIRYFACKRRLADKPKGRLGAELQEPRA